MNIHVYIYIYNRLNFVYLFIIYIEIYNDMYHHNLRGDLYMHVSEFKRNIIL